MRWSPLGIALASSGLRPDARAFSDRIPDALARLVQAVASHHGQSPGSRLDVPAPGRPFSEADRGLPPLGGPPPLPREGGDCVGLVVGALVVSELAVRACGACCRWSVSVRRVTVRGGLVLTGLLVWRVRGCEGGCRTIAVSCLQLCRVSE